MHNASYGWERKQRASHYAAELEARAGGEAALSAAGLTPDAPLEHRRLSPPLARLEPTQILLHLTRLGNEQGPASVRSPFRRVPVRWLLADYLIRPSTHWVPQRAVNVPSQRQRLRAKVLAALQTIVSRPANT